MINCIVVDDEPAAIENLTRVLKWYCEGEVEVEGTANNLDDALILLRDHAPDLIFLDVEMGDENGFMLLEKLRKEGNPIYVIFTTGHTEYAIPAMRNEAFDYLLKPVNPDDLKDSISRLKAKIEGQTIPASNNSDAATLFLSVHDQVIACNISDIIRAESESNYTSFYFVDGNRLMVSKTLGSFEDKLLPHRFFRPHKSHLINLNQLKSYVRTEGGYILMKDDSRVPLARNKRPAFFDFMGI